MEKHPPTDFVAAAFMQSKAPKPIGEAIQKSGLPIKKGKVKKPWQHQPAKSK
jgi:hypothetical protein